jgi:acetate kinase
MRVLILNCGSSTLKFQLIDTAENSESTPVGRKLARGNVGPIGADATCTFQVTGLAPEKRKVPVRDHEEAVERVAEWLLARDLRGFDAVGHRIVHGGRRFSTSILIDDGAIPLFDELSELAPLHNPPSIAAIRAARAAFGPAIPMVAAFDTSFHHTIPQYASMYAIPGELASKHGIRRYGFHGLAHEYSARRYAELTGKPKNKVDIITLHLGNGCSACAIRAGESVETSMGFTPLEGLVMGTRCGDVDPALVGYLAEKENVSVSVVETWLNKQSGLLGLSRVSSDMRELVDTYDHKPGSRLAIDVFCYRARKYLGGYLAVLGSASAVIFSGGIGENSPMIREKILVGMQWCGLELDPDANAEAAEDKKISLPESRLEVWVIHTDEESVIARETVRVIQENSS